MTRRLNNQYGLGSPGTRSHAFAQCAGIRSAFLGPQFYVSWHVYWTGQGTGMDEGVNCEKEVTQACVAM